MTSPIPSHPATTCGDAGVDLYKYITKNSEYLIGAGICIEVRPRLGALADPGHAARMQRVVGLVRWCREGGPSLVLDGVPGVGDSLLLGEAGHEVLTSAVSRVESLRLGGAAR